MKQFTQHITFKLATIAIAAFLLAPIGIKFTHMLLDHEHEVCIGKNQSHFHEIDMDCEFFKFKINHNSFFVLFDYDLKSSFDTIVSETAYYNYLKSHQQLTKPLRGPPSFLM